MVRVVVVDDDIDTVEVFCEYLQIKGVDVIGKGYDGKSAIELYEKLRPDIILLDVMMPDYDGFYGLAGVRVIDPAAKVIMVTADLTSDTERKLKNLNTSAIVYKPYEIDGIVNTIHRIIKQPEIITQ
ncbi:MAG: response regulator [Nitrososphaeria archaeon]|nr:response regulator [Nitrososphaeria archaeon]